MGTMNNAPATGWIQDSSTLLYHYFREEKGLVAHPSLCTKVVLGTGTVRRQAGEQPEGLKARYARQNMSSIAKSPGICMACQTRQEAILKRNANGE